MTQGYTAGTEQMAMGHAPLSCKIHIFTWTPHIYTGASRYRGEQAVLKERAHTGSTDEVVVDAECLQLCAARHRPRQLPHPLITHAVPLQMFPNSQSSIYFSHTFRMRESPYQSRHTWLTYLQQERLQPQPRPVTGGCATH